MLVLDTFNVLHTVGILPPEIAGLDLPGLAQLILRSRFAAQRIVFVCDGMPTDDLPAPGALAVPDHATASAEVRYSGRGETADDLIRRMIAASTAPRRMIVVSTDHEVARAARKRRCTTLSSEAFLQQLADDAGLPPGPKSPPRRPPPMMSEAQVTGWIKTFGVDEDALEAGLNDDQPRDQPQSSSGAPGPAEHPGIDFEMPAPVLPENLIDEAEALWQREARPTVSPAPPTPTIPPAAAAAYPPESTPVAPADAHSQQPRDDDQIDLDAIDMDAILPADGKARRLPRPKGSDRRN